MILVVLAGCGGGDPLDYETAMNLVRDRSAEPVKATFSASPRLEASDIRINKAYEQLTENHVLECKQAPATGSLCAPGPAGDLISQEGATDLSVVAGRWVPATIMSIRRGGRNSASAEIRMTFEPSQLYHEFETAFSDIQYPASALALADTKQGKIMRATFQRESDGWRLESLE